MACGSLIIWGFNFFVLKGIKQATIVNLIGTIAKIVPLLLFILVMAFVFNASKFSFDFWGENLIGGVKLGSLYVTSAMMQVFMLLVCFSNNAWNTMLSITSVMVLPAYFSSCAYLWKLCEDHEYPANGVVKRSSALLAATLGCVYALWLIYAAGLKYLLAAVIFMALGIPVYIWARVQNKPHEHIFSKKEFCFALLLVLLALAAIYALMIGIIKL